MPPKGRRHGFIREGTSFVEILQFVRIHRDIIVIQNGRCHGFWGSCCRQPPLWKMLSHMAGWLDRSDRSILSSVSPKPIYPSPHHHHHRQQSMKNEKKNKKDLEEYILPFSLDWLTLLYPLVVHQIYPIYSFLVGNVLVGTMGLAFQRAANNHPDNEMEHISVVVSH